MSEKTKDTKDLKESSFTKEQILKSQKYVGKKDILSTLLDASKTYTFSEVESIIEKFMKGRVK